MSKLTREDAQRFITFEFLAAELKKPRVPYTHFWDFGLAQDDVSLNCDGGSICRTASTCFSHSIRPQRSETFQTVLHFVVTEVNVHDM